MGTAIDALGTTAESPIIRRTPEAHRLGSGAIQGEVISIDRYGNAITNIVAYPATQSREGEPPYVEVEGQTVPVARTYADVHPNAAVVLGGSSGLLEIAVRDGNAAQSLGLSRGTIVTLHNAPRS
jgi:S-adenosylmethionine hydrolase